MFARKVWMQLKPGSIAKFSLLMERDVIPLLRKQKGFQDEITFFHPEQRGCVRDQLLGEG